MISDEQKEHLRHLGKTMGGGTGAVPWRAPRQGGSDGGTVGFDVGDLG